MVLFLTLHKKWNYYSYVILKDEHRSPQNANTTDDIINEVDC